MFVGVATTSMVATLPGPALRRYECTAGFPRHLVASRAVDLSAKQRYAAQLSAGGGRASVSWRVRLLPSLWLTVVMCAVELPWSFTALQRAPFRIRSVFPVHVGAIASFQSCPNLLLVSTARKNVLYSSG